MARKTNKPTEKEVREIWEVIKNFNLSDGTLLEVGVDKPNFVYQKDFSDEDWKTALETESVKLAAPPETLKKDETMVFENVKPDEPVTRVIMRNLPPKKEK